MIRQPFLSEIGRCPEGESLSSDLNKTIYQEKISFDNSYHGICSVIVVYPLFYCSVFVFQRCKGGIIGIGFLTIAYRVGKKTLPPYSFCGNAELDSGKVLSPYLNVPEVELKVWILHEPHIGIAEDGKRKLETPHIWFLEKWNRGVEM